MRHRPIWYETTVTAQGGSEMTMGYGAVPAADTIDITWVCYARSRLIGPLGLARVTATGMERPPAISDEAWRELRSAAGIMLRALLLLNRAD